MTPANLFNLLMNQGVHLDPTTLQLLTGGKDNITYRATLADGRMVVIQCMRSIHGPKHRECIEQAIEFTILHAPELGFMPTPKNLSRFYAGSDYDIQIMQYAEGGTLQESDIDESIISQIAHKLGMFHAATESFPWETYTEINYHRDRIGEFRLQAEQFVQSSDNDELAVLIAEYTLRIDKLSTRDHLRKGLIHGDPVFKNFLINSSRELVAWIDYDMMSVTTRLWDLADMYRGYIKMPDFDSKRAHLILQNYESAFPLLPAEREALPDYIRMMALDTGYRYILALDSTSGFYNTIGDSLEKARRCLRDHDRVELLSL